MALKALLLRRKIDEGKNTLAALREKDADFERREAEYAAAIEEVNAETSVEDRSALEAEINAFDQEMEEHRASAAALENEITAVRMILTGSLAGVDADTIRERLRDFYA